jgi:hypothetical protein
VSYSWTSLFWERVGKSGGDGCGFTRLKLDSCIVVHKDEQDDN